MIAHRYPSSFALHLYSLSSSIKTFWKGFSCFFSCAVPVPEDRGILYIKNTITTTVTHGSGTYRNIQGSVVWSGLCKIISLLILHRSATKTNRLPADCNSSYSFSRPCSRWQQGESVCVRMCASTAVPLHLPRAGVNVRDCFL